MEKDGEKQQLLSEQKVAGDHLEETNAADRASESLADAQLERANQAFARTYVRKANSPYGRAFLYNKNWHFAQCAELATRAAIFLSVFGAPLITGLQKVKGSFFYKNEMFSTDSIVMFVYTLYLSLGDTMTFAAEGMMGTIFAAGAAWIMFGIFEAGVKEGDLVSWWFGAVFGSLFVVFNLTLNFSTLFQVFSLSNFVWHWMAFMTSSTWDDSDIFGIKVPLYGFSGIMTAAAGCILALLSISLPYPIFALSKASDVAEDIVTCLGESWDTSIGFYTSHVRANHKQTKLKQAMRETQGYIGSLQGYLDSAWWEVRLSPKWRRTRHMLTLLRNVSNEAFDRLTHVVVRSCGREEFDSEHEKVMQACKPSIEKVVTVAKEVLTRCYAAADNGGVPDEAEEGELETRVTQVTDAMRELTQTFLSVKAELGLANRVGASLIDEHVFLFEVCVFGRLTSELATDFVSDARARRGVEGFERLEKPSKDYAVVGWLKSCTDLEVVLEREHLNFALRNSLSILSAFVVGYFGYSKMIKKRNAGISGTAAILLSKYSGSALTKNLNRLLGVVIGDLAGELLYALLGWCNWFNYAVMFACVFVWTLIMLFTYYHSARLSSIACLMAAFGTKKLLQGCDYEQVNPLKAYYDTIDCVVCIFLMMLVDQLFGLGHPSKKAATTLAEVWELIVADVTEVFSAEKETVHESSGKIVSELGRASAMSTEALEEPRYWRTPWKGELFGSALKCAYGVRLNLICIIYAVADEEGRTEVDNKEDWYMKLLQADSFRDIRSAMDTMMAQVRILSKVFEHEEVSPMEDFDSEIMRTNPHSDMQAAVSKLIEEANTDNSVLAKKDAASLKTMEEDGPGQLCFVISCIKSLMQDMEDFKFEVLAAGPA